jgi:16S rRNA (cytosine967-C5)-methyltransferase
MWCRMTEQVDGGKAQGAAPRGESGARKAQGPGKGPGKGKGGYRRSGGKSKPDAPVVNVRRLAHEALLWIEQQGAYSHIALGAILERNPMEPRDRALLTELVYGTLTWQRVIDEALLGRVVHRSLARLDAPVLIALRVAAYQLGWLDRVPAHAALHEAVEDIKRRGGQSAAGFVNGALRALQRLMAAEDLRETAQEAAAPGAARLAITWSLPDWLAARLIEERGEEEAARWAEAFVRRPPLWARQVGADEVRLDGLWSARAAMERGELVIQDLGSQRIGSFVGAKAGQRVLDACAGLGGKTLQLAELVGEEGRVVAVDPQRAKLELLDQAARKQKMAGRIERVCGELGQVAEQLEGGFDVVLVDAPCSGLGVLARHPETRWRRRAEDVDALVDVQRGLLEVAAQLVKPGGALVYSVCTWTRAEGPAQRDAFLAAHPGWRVEVVEGWRWPELLADQEQGGALATRPPEDDCDAFWAVRMIAPAPEA